MDIKKYSNIIKNKGYQQDVINIKYDRYINISKENIIGNLVGIHLNGITYRIGWNYVKNNKIIGYLSDFSSDKEKKKKILLIDLKKKYLKKKKDKIYKELINLGLIKDLSKIIINYI